MQVATPPLEFVDLPGLLIACEDRSEEIAWKFINEEAPGTLILCVIEATSGALDASPALSMLQHANQLPNTILVLTKADKVIQDEADLSMLFSRLLGKGTGPEYLNQLIGCVAVANRKHQDVVSLVQHETAEAQLFADMLEVAEQSMQPKFTLDELQRLKGKLTLKLEAEYNKRVARDWIPLVEPRGEQLVKNAWTNLDKLSEAPVQLVMKEFLRGLQAKVIAYVLLLLRYWAAKLPRFKKCSSCLCVAARHSEHSV